MRPIVTGLTCLFALVACNGLSADDRPSIRYQEMLDSGSYDALIDACSDGIKSKPNDTLNYFYRGVAYRNKRDFERAHEDFAKMLELDNKSATAFNQIGITALRKSGRSSSDRQGRNAAIRYFTLAIEADPKYADAYLQRGRCVLADRWWETTPRKDAEKALADFDRVVQLRPRDSAALSERARVLSMLGQYERAVADYDRVISIDPLRGDYLADRAKAYVKLKKYSQAIADLEKGAALERFLDTKGDLIWLLATCPDEKIRNGKRALELAEKGSLKRIGHWESLAAAYAEVGRFDEAVEWQQKALGEGMMATVRGGREKAVERLELYRNRKPYRDKE